MGLFDCSVDLVLQAAGTGKYGVAAVLAGIGAVLLGIILFFSGILGKISERVGLRMERSNHPVVRSIGNWMVDREDGKPIAGSTIVSDPQDPELRRAQHLLTMASDLQYSATQDELGRSFAGLSAANKFIKDQVETPELRAAFSEFPWLEEHVQRQIELSKSIQDAKQSVRDEASS